jgi:hypothetical protein
MLAAPLELPLLHGKQSTQENVVACRSFQTPEIPFIVRGFDNACEHGITLIIMF